MVVLFTHLSVPFQSIGHKHYNVSPYLISPGAFFPRMPPSVCGKNQFSLPVQTPVQTLTLGISGLVLRVSTLYKNSDNSGLLPGVS